MVPRRAAGKLRSLAIFAAVIFSGASPETVFAEEINSQTGTEMIALHKALSDYVKFWSRENPYKSFSEPAASEPIASSQTESVARAFAELASRYHYGIEHLDYDSAPGWFCGNGENVLEVECFDLDNSLMELWDYWTEEVVIGARGRIDEENSESEFWRLRRDLETARLEQVVKVISPWILGIDEYRSAFVSGLAGVDPDSGFDSDVALVDACQATHQPSCDRSDFEGVEAQCTIRTKNNKDTCAWVDAYYGAHLSHRKNAYADFFSAEFSAAYQRSLLVSDSDYARYIQLYGILETAGSNVTNWLNLDLSGVEATRRDAVPVQRGAVDLLESLSSNAIDSRVDCLDPNEDEHAFDEAYFEACLDPLQTELADIKKSTDVMTAYSTSKVEFLLAFRDAMVRGVTQFESRFPGVASLNDPSDHVLHSYVAALTRLSSIGLHVSRISNITQNRTLCNTGGSAQLDEKSPVDCIFSPPGEDVSSLSLRTEPLRYLKVKYSDPAIQDPTLSIQRGSNGGYLLANKVGISTSFLRESENVGSLNQYRIYDFGAYAHGLSSTYEFSLDCGVWSENAFKLCREPAPVTLSWNNSSRWLPLDKIDAVNSFIWDLGVSRLFDAYVPEINSPKGRFDPRLLFSLKPSAMRLNIGLEVELALLSGDQQSWLRSLDDVSRQVLSRVVHQVNLLIGGGRLNPKWINTPNGLVVAAFGIESVAPLKLMLLAYPAGKFQLLTSYVGAIEYETGKNRARIAWKEGQPVFPPELSYAISLVGDQIPPSALSNAVSELLFGANPVVESDADILLLSGLIDDLIAELYTSEGDALPQTRLMIAQRVYVDEHLEQLEKTLIDEFTARVNAFPPANAQSLAADLRTRLEYLVRSSALFSGQFPVGSSPIQRIIGNGQQIQAKLIDALVASLSKAIGEYAAKTWAYDCIASSWPATSVCGMPSHMSASIKALVRRTTSFDIDDDEFDKILGDFPRADFFKELEDLRIAYESALVSRADSLWIRLVDDRSAFIRRSGQDILGNLLPDAVPQCQLPANQGACNTMAERLGALAWSMVNRDADADYAALIASQRGPFRQLLQNILVSYALDPINPRDLEKEIPELASRVSTALGDLLGDTSRLPTFDLEFGDASVERLVRSQLDVFESETGELVVAANQLMLRAGDILLGLDCKETRPVKCRFLSPKHDDLQFILENSTSEIVLIKREGRETTVALGYDYKFFYSIAPAIDDVVNTPAQLFTRIAAESDELQAQHQYVESASQELRELTRMVEDRALNYALESLSYTQSMVKSLCTSSVPGFAQYCDNLGGLHKALFPSNAHIRLKRIAQAYIDAEITNDNLIEFCVQSLPDSGIVLFQAANADSCDVFAAEVKALLRQKNPQGVTTKEIYKIVSRVFDAFGSSLAGNANDERWITVARALFVIDQSVLNSVKPIANFIQAGVCLDLKSGTISLPMTGAAAGERCADSLTYFDSIETAKAEILERGAQVARPFFENYEQQLRELDSVCLDLTTPGFGSQPDQAQICGSLQEIVEAPKDFVEALSETAETLAVMRAESFALGYLESFGVTEEVGNWCIELDGIGKSCSEDPEELVEQIAELTEQQVTAEIRKRAGQTLEEIATPVRRAIEQEAARFCEELNAFVADDISLLGGKLTFDPRYDCPSSDFSLRGTLVVDSFSEKNREIRIENGLSIDVKRFRAALTAGQVPSVDTISINWSQLKFTPSLEAVIQDELRINNRYVELTDVLSSQDGLDIRFLLKPPSFDLQLPASIRVKRNTFNLDPSSAGDVVIARLCGEIDRYVTRSRLSPIDGFVITGSSESYCVQRKFRGFEFKANVDFADPIGTQEVGIIVDLDGDVRIEPPDLEVLAAAGVLAKLDLDYIRPVPPIYNYDDGLTLFLEGTIETPVGLSLTAGFAVSPGRFRFNGPVGLKIPGWYDTGVLSFGNLGLYFDPTDSVVRFDGSLSVVPGASMSNLVVMKGSASAQPREQEIRMESTLVLLRVIPMGSSVTRLSFKERLFEHTIESGPALSDVVAINGLLRIQDRAPFPFFVANGDGDLFGADIAEMQVRLGRDFSGLFGAKLRVPALDDSIDFSVTMEEKFSNPEAQGKVEINSIDPFKFEIEMWADTESVTLGLQAKPPPTSVSITLPTFKLLTEDFLIGLITDIKLRFEVPTNIDFSNSGGEKGGGGGGNGTADDAKLGGEAGDPTQPETENGKYSYRPVWKMHRERYKKTKWFGIKIGYEWAYRWVERFRDSRSAQLSRLIGVSAAQAKSLNLYYANMTASEGQAKYELLAENKSAGRIWIFDTETSSRVWSGQFSGPLQDFNGRVVTHKLADKDSFVVMRYGSEDLSIALTKSAIDGRRYLIPETREQKDDSAFARYIIRESASEIRWKGNKATPIPIGNKERSYLVAIGDAANEEEYRYVNFNPERKVNIVSYAIGSARKMAGEREFIRRALTTQEEGLHQVMFTACKSRVSSSFRNPCGQFAVASTQSLFALEPQDMTARVAGYSVRARAFAVGPGVSTLTEQVFTRDGMPTAAMLDRRGEELNLLLENYLAGLSAGTEITKLSIDLDGQMRIASFANTQGGKKVWSVTGDLEIEGERYKLRSASGDCTKVFWKPESQNGAFLAPSAESLKANKTNMDTALLLGLGFAGAYQDIGFRADPLGVTFNQCGEGL
ncbi:hypothetical protein Q4591_04810 [Shewanella sp. 3_MG-2023]|uniref:hypothetical protein n=1 Tax=Shewanella sp. 3_MG-2023 TaxID=3062635 RepID=UPI0026E3F361|nr:hypothetical protein [Shewanella sp. 3_MG-2023]MDO6774668.1 hypothetical protein [Shewanella sp. 3_MG-2023]